MVEEATDDDALPEELARIPNNPALADVLARVFKGTAMVAYHPEKALIAVWSGGTGVNVYDPNEWSAGSYQGEETGEVYHFNLPDPVQLDGIDADTYAREKFEEYGFEVVG